MITAGVDIGTRFLKICIIEDNVILGFICREMKGNFRKLYAYAFSEALKVASGKKGRKIFRYMVKATIVTGYGAYLAKGRTCRINESACTARGVFELAGEAKTVIDAGGFFIRVITVDGTGFAMHTQVNEKCAAGSGKFLELVAEAVRIPFDGISDCANASTNPFAITNSCAVFAESDVISEANKGGNPADILAGTIKSIAAKTLTLVESACAVDPVFITGGLSGVRSFVDTVERLTGREMVSAPFHDPRGITAYGAALIAQKDRTRKKYNHLRGNND